MAAWVIALPKADEPAVTQTAELDGASYVFTFDWNSRTDRWTMRLDTQGGDPVLHGALLCKGIDLLRTIPATRANVPPGQLVLGGTDDPTLDTTNTVTLFYLDAE
jgi:hypothetical protein